MATTKDIVEKFINLCQELGWIFSVGGRANSILTIYKEIEKDSLEDFVQADSEYNRILTTIPRTSPGSTSWLDGSGAADGYRGVTIQSEQSRCAEVRT